MILPRSTSRRLATLVTLLALAACGGNDGDPTGSGGTTAGSGGGGSGGMAAGGAAEGGAGGEDPCVPFSASLDAKLVETNDAVVGPGGTVAAVWTPACGLWTGAAGEREIGVAMKPSDILRVGSITKTYVAAAFVQLAEDGMLSLDDPLSSFVTTGLPNEDSITLHQLLNHSAGVFNYTEDSAFVNAAVANPTKIYEPQEIVDVAIDHGPDFEPGASWHYSNTGYILLGMVLEAVTGQGAGEHLRGAMLAPQGLEHTFLDGEETAPEPIAKGYGPNGVDWTNILPPSVPWTAGSMAANTEDLVTWARALYQGDAISPGARAAMLTFTPVSNNTYGLGVVRGTLPTGQEVMGHGGAIPGYTASLYYLPNEDIALATIVNSSARDSEEAFLALAEVVVSQAPSAP
ncbi:MAG: serine hydrolase domain-containing protein [Polyangiaceae bacterium]